MGQTRPTLCLFDLTDETSKAVQGVNGLKATVGSLGAPYKVQRAESFSVLDLKKINLSGYKEADGYVIDLRELTPYGNDGISRPPDGIVDTFTSRRTGLIDPRPYVCFHIREDVERVLAHGGLVVVFAAPLQTVQYVRGKLAYGGSHLETEHQHVATNYDVIQSAMKYCDISVDVGKEMRIVDDSPLAKLLARHLEGGSFSCTINDRTNWRDWTKLAVNKFSIPVAAYRRFGDAGGLVLLIPSQLSDEPTFAASLFRDILPELSPHLFPELQKGTWALQPPYEFEEVTHLQRDIIKVEEKAAQEVAALTKQIAEKRAANAYLLDLVRQTGTPLVLAVKAALAELGAIDVLDVDEQLIEAGKDSDFREDLQIRDRSPLLTVDVKGLTNFPSDSDALQAQKHASIRMHEYQRLDIRALAIINHQRNLPPLERDNTMPFRKELLQVASQVQMGFITGWDLHRLVRNKRRLGWSSDQVLPVLYRTGRIDPIPDHYKFIGIVQHFYEKPGVASIQLEGQQLKIGERVAFEFAVDFQEFEVASLQVAKESVQETEKGVLCGITTPFQRSEVKIGTRVFKLIAAADLNPFPPAASPLEPPDTPRSASPAPVPA